MEVDIYEIEFGGFESVPDLIDGVRCGFGFFFNGVPDRGKSIKIYKHPIEWIWGVVGIVAPYIKVVDSK